MAKKKTKKQLAKERNVFAIIAALAITAFVLFGGLFLVEERLGWKKLQDSGEMVSSNVGGGSVENTPKAEIKDDWYINYEYGFKFYFSEKSFIDPVIVTKRDEENTQILSSLSRLSGDNNPVKLNLYVENNKDKYINYLDYPVGSEILKSGDNPWKMIKLDDHYVGDVKGYSYVSDYDFSENVDGVGTSFSRTAVFIMSNEKVLRIVLISPLKTEKEEKIKENELKKIVDSIVF